MDAASARKHVVIKLKLSFLLFFSPHQECQKKLEHKLGLDSYLLKPVQRITKYQLLLKVRSPQLCFGALPALSAISVRFHVSRVSDRRRCWSTVRAARVLLTCRRRCPPFWASSRLSTTPCTSSPSRDMRWDRRTGSEMVGKGHADLWGRPICHRSVQP